MGSRKTLQLHINVAQWSMRLHKGDLSEPVLCLRVFEQFLVRRLPHRELCSMHRLRQIDGLCRELCTKLQSISRDAVFWSKRKRHQPRTRVLCMGDEELFWKFDYDRLEQRCGMAPQTAHACQLCWRFVVGVVNTSAEHA